MFEYDMTLALGAVSFNGSIEIDEIFRHGRKPASSHRQIIPQKNSRFRKLTLEREKNRWKPGGIIGPNKDKHESTIDFIEIPPATRSAYRHGPIWLVRYGSGKR